MKLFWLMTKEPLHNDHPCALVAANTEEQAIRCMTVGSDSLWVSVENIINAGTLHQIPDAGAFYENCDAIVLRMVGPPIPTMDWDAT